MKSETSFPSQSSSFLLDQVDHLMSQVNLQEGQILAQEQEIVTQQRRIRYLEERVRQLGGRFYGPRSEKSSSDERSLDLSEDEVDEIHDEAEESSLPSESSDDETSSKARGRKPLPDSLPRVEKVIDLRDIEKECSCGHRLDRIGEETSEKLHFVPAHLEVIKTIRPKYACGHCSPVGDDVGARVKIAPLPNDPFPKSIATPSLVSAIIYAKFAEGLPLYRQQQRFELLGVSLSDTTLSRWVIQLSERLQPLTKAMHQKLLTSPLINIDETRLQVLKESGRTPSNLSYLWTLKSGAPGPKLVTFHYFPSRAQQVAMELLEGYQGVVQSDGYSAYHFLDRSEGIIHAGCFAHARRKFKEAQKAASKQERKQADAVFNVALDYLQQLYKIEKEIRKRKEPPEMILKTRKEKTKPLLKNFKKWLEEVKPHLTSHSLNGKAVKYTLNQWDQLTAFVEIPFVTPDNNSVENAIRPVAIGRKNWLFTQSVKGAHATATFYSLIESAKINGLHPTQYLKHLIENIHRLQQNPALFLPNIISL